MKKSWLIVCLINFCLAALMGILMRLAYVVPMDFNYAYLLHGHSHTVILGWCYLAVYDFVVHHFLSKQEQQKPIYNRLFWVTELAVVGMMLSFPFQGYAFFSILFSTLHIFCSYFFCYLIIRNGQFKSIIGRKMLQTALFFMVFSTVGVWCLGPVAASGAKDSAFYNLAIQFFLHFQFNGWFVFAVLGLFFHKLQQSGVQLCPKTFLNFYDAVLVSTLLTFALPVSWYVSSSILGWANSIGLLLQLVALFYLIKLLLPHRKMIQSNLSRITKVLYAVAFFCLVTKILIQSATAFPEIAMASHSIRNFTVGFIHLVMLGIVNSFLFAFISESQHFVSKYKLGHWSIMLFLSGFIIMELLLFHQGFCVFTGIKVEDFHPLYLLLSSIVVTIGLLLLLIHISRSKKTIS